MSNLNITQPLGTLATNKHFRWNISSRQEKNSHACDFVWEKKVPQNPMVYPHLHTTIAIVFGVSVVGLPNSEPNWRARTLGQDPP